MKLKEMIKVMQHYENGGEVEMKAEDENDTKWRISTPFWNWANFEYRIKKQEPIITIEKWICKDRQGDFSIVESSNINKYEIYEKVKLIESYEVEL